MNNDTLRRMLELTYELEGLLDMAINREEVSPLILELIQKKVESIRSLSPVVEPEEEPVEEPVAEPEEEPVEEPEPVEDEPEPVEENHPQADKKYVSTFSINDRFLFSRELFGGNVADFERALKEVAAFDTYEEAEEYFYSEYGFDQDNPTVADFMIRISRYFDI